MEKTLDFMFAEAKTPVRTIFKDNEVWFVLADVCEILNIKESHRVAARLDDDEKGRTIMTTPGGEQEMTIVSEAGLYHVILTSRSEKARVFRRWVTHEVLPSIRKQGYYSAISDDDLIAILTEKRNNDPKYIYNLKLSQREEKTLKTVLVSKKMYDLLERITEMSRSEFDQAMQALFNEGLTNSQYTYAMNRYTQYEKRTAKTKRERLDLPSWISDE